jgi:hypothetical protein
MAEGDDFRARATLIFWVISVVLILGVVFLGWVGWKIRRGPGLAIGVGVGGLLALILWMACGLIYAMTQDGG